MTTPTQSNVQSVHDAVEVDHAFLRKLLAWVEGVDNDRSLRILLDDLEGYLKAHFAAEEKDGGLFEATVRRAPKHHRAVERLRAEHTQILEDLAALRAMVPLDLEAVPNGVKTKVEELVTTLRRHESDEGLLLLDAIQSELGGGD